MDIEKEDCGYFMSIHRKVLCTENAMRRDLTVCE